MGVFFLPFTIKEQLKTIRDLLRIRFLKHDEKKELETIENELRLNIPLNMDQKESLKTIIAKYGAFA